MGSANCGVCGAEIRTGVTLGFRDGPMEGDKQVLFYTLTIEPLGGCEHADTLRDERILRPDPDSLSPEVP